jgi:hypothetical protein
MHGMKEVATVILTSLAFLVGTQFMQQRKTSQQLLQGILIHPVASDVIYPYETYMFNDLQKKANLNNCNLLNIAIT